jgi:phage-related protein
LRRDKQYCTLISLSPKYSHATYFDSGSAIKKKDYTNIKKVLDDALTGYASSGGTFERPNVRYGNNVFTHVTDFACVKQPPDSQKDAYYALYHMRAFVRDQQDLTLPRHLQAWARELATKQDSDIRQEFFRIQMQFSTIIVHDVSKRGGSSTAASYRLIGT